MSHEAFMEAICAALDKDGPRLLYADWLEEREDPRGEFIRVQCALARMPAGDTRRPELQQREDNLLRQHRAAWGVQRLDARGASVIFRRGFPERISSSLGMFLDHANELFKLAPTIRALNMVAYRPSEVVGLASCMNLRNIITLNLGGDIGDEGAQALAENPYLSNLTTLDLLGGVHNQIGAAGALALARSPHLRELNALLLGVNNIGPVGAEALAASENVAKLTTLNLAANNLGPEGAQFLAAAPHLSGVTKLLLAHNDIGPAGARALAASPHLRHLSTLSLSNNGIGDEGAQALAASENVAKLTALYLASNEIGDAGALALADSPRLARLSTLDLGFNDIGPAGAQALVESPHLRKLTAPDFLGGNYNIGGDVLTGIQSTMALRRAETSTGRGGR